MKMLKNVFCSVIVLLLFAVSCTVAQVPFFGRCPDRRVVENFNVQAYLGRWFEIEKYFAVFEAGGTCIEANYSDLGNGTVRVLNKQVQQKTGERRQIEGTARLTDPNGSGKLGVTFPSVPFAGEAPYWVLDTDYTSYSIVSSCNDFAVVNFQIVWFLARERNPNPQLRQQVHDKMAAIGIRRDFLRPTAQSNCNDP